MLVYDVTCKKSFDNIKYWINDIQEVSEYNDIIVIVCLIVIVVLVWYLSYICS